MDLAQDRDAGGGVVDLGEVHALGGHRVALDLAVAERSSHRHRLARVQEQFAVAGREHEDLGIAGEDAGSLLRRRFGRYEFGRTRVRRDRIVDLTLRPERAAQSLVQEAGLRRVGRRVDQVQEGSIVGGRTGEVTRKLGGLSGASDEGGPGQTGRPLGIGDHVP